MRQFASGLLCGKPLVESLAAGRGAAFRGEPPSAKSADWHTPACSSPTRSPSASRRSTACASALPHRSRRRSAAGSPTVFGGRREFFDTYARIVRAPGGLEVLVVLHTADESGLGRHRLLKELAAQALRDGHVPFVVEPRQEEGGPIVSSRDLAIRVLYRVRHLRELLGLGPPAKSRILHELALPLPPPSEDPTRSAVARFAAPRSARRSSRRTR